MDGSEQRKVTESGEVLAGDKQARRFRVMESQFQVLSAAVGSRGREESAAGSESQPQPQAGDDSMTFALWFLRRARQRRS